MADTGKAGLSMRLEGHDVVLGQISDTLGRLDNPLPLWEAIGNALVVSTQKRFEDEEAPDGTPWPASIRVLLNGGVTLTDTARLKNSITFEASAEGVQVGTNVIYAAVHQLGAVIKPVAGAFLTFKVGGRYVRKASVEIPARPFLGLSDDDEAELADIAGSWAFEPLEVENAR